MSEERMVFNEREAVTVILKPPAEVQEISPAAEAEKAAPEKPAGKKTEVKE